jgi:predicted nuclease with RNAse H fold
VIRPLELSFQASPARRFTRFVGVALGGGRGKTTAVARLELDMSDETEGAAPRVRLAEARLRHGHRGSGQESGEEHGDPLFRDEVLVAYLQRWAEPTTVVAIDAPLTLPPCIRCTLPCPGVQACVVPAVQWMRRHAPALHAARRSDPGKPAVTPYTQRAVDVLLTHVGLSPRESLGQGMGPLAARAAYLRRALSPQLRLHENLLEVYPPATVARLFGAEVERRQRRSDSEQAWDLRKRVLSALAPALAFDYVWPEVVVRSPHVFEAVIAGFTAFMWAYQGWQGPPDLLSQAVSEPAEGVREPLTQAVADFDRMWLEDGWIWVPPASSPADAGRV